MKTKEGRYLCLGALLSRGRSNELGSNAGGGGPRVHTHRCTHAALHVLQDVIQRVEDRQLIPHR